MEREDIKENVEVASVKVKGQGQLCEGKRSRLPPLSKKEIVKVTSVKVKGIFCQRKFRVHICQAKLKSKESFT